MLIIEGWLHFAPGEIEKFIEAAQLMVDATREEEGCLHYAFARDLNDPDILRIAERWTDEAALEAHFKSAHMVAFGTGLALLQRIGSDVRLYDGDEVRRVM
jgi:quinol monooxygenase YgiN|tara:strand:- start:411 stop:713 length:303 start_codon:yes stop_codon:yes gene_type:complete